MDKRQNRIPLLMVLIIMAVLLAFVLGLMFGSSSAQLVKRCTEQVTATVVRVDTDTRHGTHGQKTYYFPVYSYTFKGQAYQQKSNVNYKEGTRQAGQTVMLKINPYQPEEFLDPAYKRTSGAGMFTFFALAFGFLIFLVYGGISSMRAHLPKDTL